MSVVNYSKWDKMLREMSDSDDDESTQPTVTTFDSPQSVTFGGNVAPQGKGAEKSISKDYSERSDESERRCQSEAGEGSSIVAGGTVEAPVTDEQLVENGAAVLDNDGRVRCVWRQNRVEVIAVFPVPSETRARDVEISLNPKSETFTEGVADLIHVALKGGCVLVDGELAFQSKLEDNIEWELKDFPGTRVAADPGTVETSQREESQAASEPGRTQNAAVCKSFGYKGRRGLEVTLKKHCPIPGAAIWWKSFLKGDPEIDVSNLKCRAKNAHQSAWEEAMGMFKAKMAERKRAGRISIDTGETG